MRGVTCLSWVHGDISHHINRQQSPNRRHKIDPGNIRVRYGSDTVRGGPMRYLALIICLFKKVLASVDPVCQIECQIALNSVR